MNEKGQHISGAKSLNFDEGLTSCWIYSHIRSLMGGVLASCLIALSISLMIPSWGEGNWPELIMTCAVTEVSDPRRGEETLVWSSAKKQFSLSQGRVSRRRTTCVEMLLYFKNEIPYFRTTFRILKTEGVVYSVGFSPHNQCICKRNGDC